jgi:hypothetical protein
VKKLSAEGKLTGPAALFAAPRKPIEELYDLAADPHEINNLASDPAHKTTLKKLRALVDDWTAAMDDQGRYMEDPVKTHLGYKGTLPQDTPPQKPKKTIPPQP